MNLSLVARAIDADLLDRTLDISAKCAAGVDAEMAAGQAAVWEAVL